MDDIIKTKQSFFMNEVTKYEFNRDKFIVGEAYSVRQLTYFDKMLGKKVLFHGVLQNISRSTLVFVTNGDPKAKYLPYLPQGSVRTISYDAMDIDINIIQLTADDAAEYRLQIVPMFASEYHVKNTDEDIEILNDEGE